MKRIRLLDEKVINHIAAGEIIERPASIVKELMENSLDANANSISVIVENGGKKLIEVIDNGSGMSEDDALLCLERHATSKIYSLKDINDIATLGFRGEAIPSIAQVSSMEITSLPQNNKNQPATNIKIFYGNINDVTKTAGNPGTRIKVKNLFNRVPARKKFLKTARTEFRHILNLFQNIACINPEVSFILIHNNRETLNYPKVNLLEKRIAQIFGDEFFQSNIVPIQETNPQIEIHGFLGSFRGNIFEHNVHKIFINNRAINDRFVYSAIKMAFEPFTKKRLNKNEIPLYIIFLNITPDKIDFNVSPTKNEVRFINSNFVFNFVKNSVRDALLNHEKQNIQENSPTQTSFEKPNFSDRFSEKTNTHSSQSNSLNAFHKEKERFSDHKTEMDNLFLTRKSQNSDKTDFVTNKKDVQLVSFFDEKIVKNKNKIVETEMINPWQLGESFIMVEQKSGVMIIDQHAAHERVLYEKIKEYFEKKRKDSDCQRLLFPLVIDLPKYLQQFIPELIDEHHDLFVQAGFQLKVFSGNSVVVDGIPAYLKNWDNGEILLNIFKYLEQEYQPKMDFKDKLAQSMACHAAIKINHKLSKKEMLELINQLFACNNPFVCPHGRPTIIDITFEELYKRFKRT